MADATQNSRIAKALAALRLDLSKTQERELSGFEKKLADARRKGDVEALAAVLENADYRQLADARETQRACDLLRQGLEKSSDPFFVLATGFVAVAGVLTALRLRYDNEDSLKLAALQAQAQRVKELEHRAERHAKHLQNLDARVKK